MLPAVADPGFSRQGMPTLKAEASTYCWPIFSQKLHENERNWTEKGHGSLVPLASANGHYWQMRVYKEHIVDFEIGFRILLQIVSWCKSSPQTLYQKTNQILNKFASVILVTQFSDEFFTISSQYKNTNIANFVFAVPF